MSEDTCRISSRIEVRRITSEQNCLSSNSFQNLEIHAGKKSLHTKVDGTCWCPVERSTCTPTAIYGKIFSLYPSVPFQLGQPESSRHLFSPPNLPIHILSWDLPTKNSGVQLQLEKCFSNCKVHTNQLEFFFAVLGFELRASHLIETLYHLSHTLNHFFL
jgi:hypothetical protein